MRALKNREEIRDAYAVTHVAEEYIDKRFGSAWGSVLHEAQVRVVNEVVRTYSVNRILEIAPGPARLSGGIVGFTQGYLCDANEHMLRVARRRLEQARAQDGEASARDRWRLIQGDAFNLPFRGPFDMVCAFRFIRHFEPHDRVALYAQIHSVLKENGLFVFDAVNLTVALPWRKKEGLDKHPVYDELFRRDALVQELNANGFRVLSLTEVIRHMTLQHWVQVFIGPRSHWIAKRLIQLLECVAGQPLEWIGVCQKR